MIAAGSNVISIPRLKIKPFTGQPREEFGYDRLRELAESMRERGQLQPLIVRAAEGGKEPWQLVDGERRWRAAELAGIETLLAIVSDVKGGDDQYIASIIANSAREDLSPVEQSRAVARVAAMPEFKQSSTQGDWLRKIAKVFGKSTTWVDQMIKLDGCAPEVKTMVETRKMSTPVAVELSSMKSHARQAEVGKRISAQPMRQGAAINAAKQAAQVERVREGGDAKQLPGTRGRNSALQDLRLVEELVGRLADTAESALDLPVARLREAFAGKKSELSKAIARISGAVDALDQLQQSLERLSEEK